MKDENQTNDVADIMSRLKTSAQNKHVDVPEGKLEEVITYLEMRARPARKHLTKRLDNLAVMRAHRPTVSFYRYLYNSVGAPWLWYERRLLHDDALKQIISDENVYVYVLYVGGVPAGYVELDARVRSEIEIAYFGLIPEFVGRGLGQYFLNWSVDKAWSFEPQRVWVHTCNHDHPHAGAIYQRAGFVPYRQERNLIDDPRRLGIF